MSTALGLLGVVLLIAANGYFVAGEFAFVASRRAKFVERADEGDRRSKRALAVHKRLSFMLSGAQLGITVTSLVLGFIAEPALAGAIEPLLEAVGLPESATFGIAVTGAFILATVAQMVFGELAPKNLAIAKPEPVARALAPSTLLFMRVAGPLIRLFDGAANRLLRLLGIEPVDEIHGSVSTDELDFIVDSSAESGQLTRSQASLLERAIDFGELEASDAMVAWNRTTMINVGATAADLRDLMASNHSRFPVVDDDGKVVGLVHAKDLLGVPRDAYHDTPISSLVHDVLAVPEAAGLSVVLSELQSHSTEMAIVIDEYGGPAGVVTLEDLVEELVGEIEDEYDPTAPGEFVEVESGVWSIAATSRPDEIERYTGFELPDGEYDTVAGLVLDRLERLAEVGDKVVVDGMLIEVLDIEEFAITQVLLQLDPESGIAHDGRRRRRRCRRRTTRAGRMIAATDGLQVNWVALALAVVLLALNAFFVAAEFALLASRRSRIEQLAAEGSRRAKSALSGIRELTVMLAGAQLGITMCSLGLGAVAEPAVAQIIEGALGGVVSLSDTTLHVIGFTIGLSIVVFLHMVVGEMAPKSWAISDPESSALRLALPFRAFVRVFQPVIWVLNGLANLIVRMVGVEPQDERAMAHSPSDLLLLLDESAGHGDIDHARSCAAHPVARALRSHRRRCDDRTSRHRLDARHGNIGRRGARGPSHGSYPDRHPRR